MNNVAKFGCTGEEVRKLQGQLPKLKEKAEKLYVEKGISSKKHMKVIRKIMYIGGLSIDNKKDIISFNVDGIHYVQHIHVRRRRINVVPCCFLIQLYKEKLKGANLKPNEYADIPFELRGFWKMDKVLQLLKELSRMQISCTRSIQRMLNYKDGNTKKVKEALKNLGKAIEELKILSPQQGCIEVMAGDEKFTVKMRNTKLDVVPLCKFVATYYIVIIEKIAICAKVTTDELVVNQAMAKMLNDFESLMKEYFIRPIIK